LKLYLPKQRRSGSVQRYERSPPDYFGEGGATTHFISQEILVQNRPGDLEKRLAGRVFRPAQSPKGIRQFTAPATAGITPPRRWLGVSFARRAACNGRFPHEGVPHPTPLDAYIRDGLAVLSAPENQRVRLRLIERLADFTRKCMDSILSTMITLAEYHSLRNRPGNFFPD
jgi:hypothetical protein